MKNKILLLYVIGAATVAYLIFKKKPTAPAANVLQDAKETANEILTTVDILPTPEQFIKPKEIVSLPFFPINITQTETSAEPQLSPTPASILSPEQLNKFNQTTSLLKGQLMGVC